MNTPEEIRHWDEKQAERIEALEAEITRLQQEQESLNAQVESLSQPHSATYQHGVADGRSGLGDLILEWRTRANYSTDEPRRDTFTECADQLAQCFGDPQ